MELRTCQDCQKEFVLESDDFSFFERMSVPPPTFCPECRLRRQLSFRHARNLYRRKDSSSGKDIIAIYSPAKEMQGLWQWEWNGDGWDPMASGREDALSRPFFAQL